MRLLVLFCASLLAIPCLVADGVLQVSEADARLAARRKFEPTYPPMAKQLNIHGSAEVELFIDEGGNPEQVKPLAGNPLLTGAVSQALSKWKFTPFLLDGKPSKAVCHFKYQFSH